MMDGGWCREASSSFTIHHPPSTIHRLFNGATQPEHRDGTDDKSDLNHGRLIAEDRSQVAEKDQVVHGCDSQGESQATVGAPAVAGTPTQSHINGGSVPLGHRGPCRGRCPAAAASPGR